MTLRATETWLEAMNWGTVPDWVGALGAIAAFLIAAITYLNSVRHGWKAQARRVNIRDTRATTSEPGKTVPLVDGSASGVKMVMPTRLGELPTFAEASVVTTVGVHNGSDEVVGPVLLEVIIDGHSPADILATHRRRTIQPGADFKHTFSFADRWAPMSPGFISRITFRDAAGQWWQRIEGGPVRTAPKDARFKFEAEAGRRLSAGEWADAAREHNRSTFE